MFLLWLTGGLSAEIARLDNSAMTPAVERTVERDTPVHF
jgi:hypothetical protein